MAINLNFERMGIDIKGDKAAEIATPMPVCKDMVDLFDFTDSNNKIWMDMYCKTGNTLEALKDRGVLAENIVAICPSKQSQLFACRKLYGQLLPEETVKIEIRSLNNYIITRRGQVYWISNWKDIVKNSSQDAYNLIKIVMKSEMEKAMGKFEINNIVMNPPYNNDLYLDFVTLAHKIATDSVVAITPAKWQTKESTKDNSFRRDIVPYISSLIFYPSCSDVFEIKIVDGIAIYCIGKEKQDKITVENRCMYQKLLESTQVRSIRNQEPLLNALNDVIITMNKSGNTYKPMSVEALHKDGDYIVYGNRNISGSRGKPGMYQAIGTISYASGNSRVLGYINVAENNKETRDLFTTADTLWMASDNIDECKSFESWIQTKFVQFCLFGWISTRTIDSDASFRKVPDPGSFDHIFTDRELYQKYNLTPDEINIIESVIKERKEK